MWEAQLRRWVKLLLVTRILCRRWLSGQGWLQKVDVGSEATIKITTKDSDGNQRYDENDQIYVKVHSPSGN